MKLLFTVLAVCTTGLLFGQTPLEGKISGVQITQQEFYLSTDTVPKVVYLDRSASENKPAFYLNGEIVKEQVLKTIDPNQIADVKVDTDTRDIAGVQYQGAVHITMKDGYQPHFLSLKALKEKHTQTSELPTLFFLNNEAIDADYDQYLVDEKYLLKIEVNTINNPQEGLSLNLIRLLTRSQDNLERVNRIILRGEEGE